MTDPSILSWLSAPLVGFLTGIVCSWTGLTPANAVIHASQGDNRLQDTLLFALGISITAFHALAAHDIINLDLSLHAESTLNWTGLVFGSIIFGVGMAVARTDILCATLQIGRGNLSAVAIFLVIAIMTLAGTDGLISPVIDVVQQRAVVDLAKLDIPSVNISSLIILASELNPFWIYYSSATLGLLISGYVLITRHIWKQPSLLITGLVLGFALPALLASSQTHTGLPYLLLEPPRLIASFMGIPGITASPITLLIIGIVVGSAVLFSIPAQYSFPQPPTAWRSFLGTLCMAIGGVMASGDIISHAAVGGGSLALPSLGCVYLIMIVSINTAKMLDG